MMQIDKTYQILPHTSAAGATVAARLPLRAVLVGSLPLLLGLLSSLPATAAEPAAIPVVVPVAATAPAAPFDRLMEDAIHKGLIAGGVVFVGSRRQDLFTKAYGRVSSAADARPTTTDTIFDIASLTKVIATTPSVLKLAEEGRLSLLDPLAKWFPEFAAAGKGDLLILHLLTHTSTLNDFGLDPDKPMESAIRGAALQKGTGELGSRFHYADINFILLAETVRRAGGKPLDEFAAERFYAPLGMGDTGFHPPAARLGRIAATVGDGAREFVGEPQDQLSRQLGGVAGHAGLFSTAADLARFCRMILGGGQLAGKRVLEQRSVDQMTAPYFSRGGRVIRGLGWDIVSPFSSPRGDFFSRGSFGHTGYSGSSVWIDPDADLFVILLTTRLEYHRTAEFSHLRSALSSQAAMTYGLPVSLRELEDVAAGAAGTVNR